MTMATGVAHCVGSLLSKPARPVSCARPSLARHPIGRIGEPSDVAMLGALPRDPAQSWLTGQVIGADDGMTTLRSM